MSNNDKSLLRILLGAGLVIGGIVFAVTVGGRDAMAQVSLDDKAALVTAYQVEARDAPVAVEQAAYSTYVVASAVAKAAAEQLRVAGVAGTPTAGSAEHDVLLETAFQADAAVAEARLALDTARRARAEAAPEGKLTAIYRQRCAQSGAPVVFCSQFRELPDGGQ